ncbi:TrkA-C domain protein [Ferroglobus placidus DSM 10642]|uniref:TrkA-C domain protein n=1 Tax=Ferroglobus placidus (strain DSM 10642 / AEDII12DO) TaxID=589924 RepID=D3RWL3_FERPA|nr:TrkA C-terminal domain-containing protein [Ferroglobus placidus]ADC64876.1 TrkA-C domain protein [Ferroglobus placidus DSM 10642]
MTPIDLSGIGTKYELETESGNKIAILFLESGRVQIYILEKGCAKPCVIELSQTEAIKLGNILSGAILQTEREGFEISAMADVRLNIHKYVATKKVSGKSIKDLAIRKKTGVTVIAVSRDKKTIVNPSPDFVIKEGDVLLVIGESEQVKKFEKEILGI